MELTSITAALSSVKSAVEIAKLIKESGSSLEGAELKFKLAELIETLADTKIELANIKEILLEKENEIKILKEQVQTNKNMIWEEPYYFLLKEEGEKDGPYCQKCYDSKKMLIRLQSPNKNGHWECKECESQFMDKTFGSGPQSAPPNLMGVVKGRSW